jgi:hypothetical protein
MAIHQIRDYYIPQWPQWFRDIYQKFSRLYPGATPNQGGDVLVCICRSTWPCHPGQMVILGSQNPSAQDWNAAGVTQRMGDEQSFWLSAFIDKDWHLLVTEARRGIYRPWGVLQPNRGSTNRIF